MQFGHLFALIEIVEQQKGHSFVVASVSTTLSAEKVAKISLKALRKKKAVVIPGVVNKLVAFFSKFCSYHGLAKTTGKMWKKSQKKRNF